MPAFIRYGLKQFTASLGRNVFSIWMSIYFSPFLKPEHGGIVLQNEVVDNGKHLSVTVGKTHLQVGGNPNFHSDLIQQIGCSVIKPSGMDSRDWTTLWSICNRFRNRLIKPGRWNKVAVIVEALTDNKNRTASNVRSIFGKRGGAMGETGSVSFNFERIGYIEYPMSVADADKMFEEALEAGANEVISEDDIHAIETLPDDLSAVTEALEKKFGTPSASRLDWKPTVKTEITDLETAKKFLEFIDALEEDEDVQHVYHNADIAENIMAELSEGE